jgi:uncharacterized protein YdaU (DUF1376 family)
MSKNTLYFRHDCNARADRKLVKLASKLNMSGVGIYWCMIEMLYEEGGYIPLEYERISYELRTDYDTIKSVIHDFELFSFDKDKFWSERVLEELKERCDKSDKARKSIESRWLKYRNTNVIQTNKKRNTKENRIEENKINIIFDVFWNLYNKKVGSRKKCEVKWNKLSDENRQKIIDTLPEFLSKIRDKQFQPFPETYLNQERWNDEIITTPALFVPR